jgi:hypothetical protein
MALMLTGLMTWSSLVCHGSEMKTNEELYKELKPSVVTIKILDENHKYLGHGTGFIIGCDQTISPDEFMFNALHQHYGMDGKPIEPPVHAYVSTIVTNYHVVSNLWKDPSIWHKYSYIVTLSDGVSLPPTQEVVYDPETLTNHDHDVALLICTELTYGPEVRVATFVPRWRSGRM